MAKNPNPKKANNHHLITATSGGGKTSWLKRQKAIINAARLVVWDPDEDHEGIRFYNRAQFARGLSAAVKSRKRFKLCLTVHASRENFEWFCRAAWSILDGDRNTYIVVEEVADVVPAGKAPPAWGQLLRRGRKYGAIIFAVTQRPAECDKTLYSQTAFKWVGIQENEADRKRLSGLLDIPQSDISGLKPLEYFHKKQGEAAKKGRVTF